MASMVATQRITQQPWTNTQHDTIESTEPSPSRDRCSICTTHIANYEQAAQAHHRQPTTSMQIIEIEKSMHTQQCNTERKPPGPPSLPFTIDMGHGWRHRPTSQPCPNHATRRGRRPKPPTAQYEGGKKKETDGIASPAVDTTTTTRRPVGVAIAATHVVSTPSSPSSSWAVTVSVTVAVHAVQGRQGRLWFLSHDRVAVALLRKVAGVPGAHVLVAPAPLLLVRGAHVVRAGASCRCAAGAVVLVLVLVLVVVVVVRPARGDGHERVTAPAGTRATGGVMRAALTM